eukprot:270827-Chlamydomonas_euryale.AAC.4
MALSQDVFRSPCDAVVRLRIERPPMQHDFNQWPYQTDLSGKWRPQLTSRRQRIPQRRHKASPWRRGTGRAAGFGARTQRRQKRTSSPCRTLQRQPSLVRRRTTDQTAGVEAAAWDGQNPSFDARADTSHTSAGRAEVRGGNTDNGPADASACGAITGSVGYWRARPPAR